MVNCGCGLTAREREILRLATKGLTDYRLARKLRVEAPNITRSRLNTLRKIDKAQADLEFFDSLGWKVSSCVYSPYNSSLSTLHIKWTTQPSKKNSILIHGLTCYR